MYTTMSPGAGIPLALLACLIGAYALAVGYARVRNPEHARPIFGRISLWMTRLMKGKSAAAKKEAEIMNPANIHRSGQWAMVVGSAMLIGGLLQLCGWLLKLNQ